MTVIFNRAILVAVTSDSGLSVEPGLGHLTLSLIKIIIEHNTSVSSCYKRFALNYDRTSEISAFLNKPPVEKRLLKSLNTGA